MLSTPLDVAPAPGDFNFLPLMLVVLVVIIALVAALFLVRGRRQRQHDLDALRIDGDRAGFIADLGWAVRSRSPGPGRRGARAGLSQSRHGFAAAIIGALIALGLWFLMAMFVSSKPRNRRR